VREHCFGMTVEKSGATEPEPGATEPEPGAMEQEPVAAEGVAELPLGELELSNTPCWSSSETASTVGSGKRCPNLVGNSMVTVDRKRLLHLRGTGKYHRRHLD